MSHNRESPLSRLARVPMRIHRDPLAWMRATRNLLASLAHAKHNRAAPQKRRRHAKRPNGRRRGR